MDVFEWCICLIVSHTSPSWAWCVSTQLRFYCLIQKMKLLSCNKRQTWCIALYTLTFFLIFAMDFYRATIMWLTLKEGDISSPPWICIWHNETKYDATMHLQDPSIGWNKLRLNRRDFFFQAFGQLMSQQCVFYQSVSTNIFNPIFIHSTTDYMHRNWQQLLVNVQQKGCDNFSQFPLVITSLRQFVTAGAS